jgi:hypothetical protein
MFPCAAFLSFSTFLFPLCFLLVHSLRLELYLGRIDGLGPGSRTQDAHRERFGQVLHGKQYQSSVHHTTQTTSRKLPHRSRSSSMSDMPLRQRCSMLVLQTLCLELHLYTNPLIGFATFLLAFAGIAFWRHDRISLRSIRTTHSISTIRRSIRTTHSISTR